MTAGYRKPTTELTLLIDDELREEIDALSVLTNGALDRGAVLIAAARRALPALRAEADVHAARNVARCPRCHHVGLAPRDEGGVLLQSCIECGGSWLDNASLRRVFAEPSDTVIELATRVQHNARANHDVAPPLSCPACEAALVRRQEANSGVRIDSCDRHGTWFDRGELVRFATVVAERRRALADLATAASEPALGEIGNWFAPSR